ncbi:hypothetical protein RRG08_020249 [Elysia crispata]|uniref:Uncharacterized protein n=1 Tax=Elysia crispata TaxID=231223 RepID=A0AAE0ZZJ4_9GAST|nr:hypothetical protein RRG08_020249 [Elysia crispata]
MEEGKGRKKEGGKETDKRLEAKVRWEGWKQAVTEPQTRGIYVNRTSSFDQYCSHGPEPPGPCASGAGAVGDSRRHGRETSPAQTTQKQKQIIQSAGLPYRCPPPSCGHASRLSFDPPTQPAAFLPFLTVHSIDRMGDKPGARSSQHRAKTGKPGSQLTG